MTELKTIKLKVAMADKSGYWNSGPGIPEVMHVIEDTPDNRRSLDELWNLDREDYIQDGDKVYFTESSRFPRYKFRESFPKNSIVRNIEKADVIVMDYAIKCKQMLGYSNYNTYKKLEGYTEDVWTNSYNATTYWKKKVIEDGSSYVLNTPIYGRAAEELAAISRGNKRIIYDDTLLKNINQDCVELTLDMMDNIAGLLNSNDKDDVKIAINICTTLNFEKYGHIIAYLILQCGKRFNTWYGIGTGSLGKLFIDKLEKQYNLQNSNVHQFLKNVVMNKGAEDHEFVEKCLQVYIDQHVGANLFKVTRI